MRYFVLLPWWLVAFTVIFAFPFVAGFFMLWYAAKGSLWLINRWRVSHGRKPWLPKPPPSPREAMRQQPGGNPYLGSWAEANHQWESTRR